MFELRLVSSNICSFTFSDFIFSHQQIFLHANNKIINNYSYSIYKIKLDMSNIFIILLIIISIEVYGPRIGYNVNAILPEEEEAIVEYAKANPNYMHRSLTWRLIDDKITYAGTTTIYGILRENGLICDNKLRVRYGWIHKYSNEANLPDERWQTDITYLQYKGRDVYQLSFIDVYSRFIVFSITLLNMES
jgi:hypothetical protein